MSPCWNLGAALPGQAPAAAGHPLWTWLREIAAEPALVELLLVGAVAAAAGLTWLGLARLVRNAQTRAAVHDYLLGLEQAQSGDLAGAAKRLQRVLAEDPENHHARLLLGEVLAEQGDPAEAHKHHLQLQRAFGMDNVRNDLALAQSLMDVGRPAEAVEAAQRAVSKAPRDPTALRRLFQAQLAAGFPEAAGRTGAQLASVLTAGERDTVCRQAADALCLAARVRLEAGDLDAARALLREAESLSAAAEQLTLVRARLALASTGKAAALASLRAEDGVGTRLLTADRVGGIALLANASGQSSVPAPQSASTSVQPVGAFSLDLAALVPSSPYRCLACGGGLATALAVCPHCAGRGTARAQEPALFGEIESPSQVMDEIDENKAHVRRLVQRAAARDADAELELLEIGAGAVEEILAAALKQSETTELAMGLLQRMGAPIVGALFEAHARLKDRRLKLGQLLGRGDSATLIGRIVQGFGRDAVPHFQNLLDTEDRDQRKIILDFFIGLGDQKEFHHVLDRFPPVEVVHRLNAAPPPILQRLVSTVEPLSFLADVLLVDPIFARDVDALHAIPRAADPKVLIGILVRRGYNRDLAEALIAALADAPLAGAAAAVLDSFGMRALDHVVAAFADLDQPTAVRAATRQRLLDMGARVVDKLSECFGAAPTALDPDLESLLGAMGDAAVVPLQAAYQRSSLLEKLAAPLVRRHTHRRVAIIRVLATIGGPNAIEALKRMRERESDNNLKLRLAQALQRAAAAASDARPTTSEHGEAG